MAIAAPHASLSSAAHVGRVRRDAWCTSDVHSSASQHECIAASPALAAATTGAASSSDDTCNMKRQNFDKITLNRITTRYPRLWRLPARSSGLPRAPTRLLLAMWKKMLDTPITVPAK